MSQAKDQGYFSDGISEELLNLLAKIPQLKVAARTSSFSFKGKQVEIPEIARQLHVANVLEGSVRKSGDQLRITVQLIRAAEGYHLWSETYDRKMDDIFKIQDEIADEVVKRLKITLLGAAPKVRQTDPEAYALTLQARALGRENTPEAFTKADALLHEALTIDPGYVVAWERLAGNFINITGQGLLPSEEGYARAREAAEKALAIDPDYAPAHSALGWIAMSQNDLAGAARHYERACALDPTDLVVLNSTANFLGKLGRLDEALALMEAIVRRDPLNVTTRANLSSMQVDAGRYDAAIASLRDGGEPERDGPRALCAWSCLASQRRCAGRISGDGAGEERALADDWPADGLPRARAQGRLRCGTRRTDREIREDSSVWYRLRLRLSGRGRQGIRVAG